MPFHINVSSDDLKALAKAFRAEEDGKLLRKELRANMRDVLIKPRDEARAAIKAMPSRGHAGTSLRSTVAKNTVIAIRLSGRGEQVRLITRKTPDLRGFKSAPRWTNRGSWRHPIYGNRNRWVTQKGPKNWFDGTVLKHGNEYRRAVMDAVVHMRDRLAKR